MEGAETAPAEAENVPLLEVAPLSSESHPSDSNLSFGFAAEDSPKTGIKGQVAAVSPPSVRLMSLQPSFPTQARLQGQHYPLLGSFDPSHGQNGPAVFR
jgi:hypothetical protein